MYSIYLLWGAIELNDVKRHGDLSERPAVPCRAQSSIQSEISSTCSCCSKLDRTLNHLWAQQYWIHPHTGSYLFCLITPHSKTHATASFHVKSYLIHLEIPYAGALKRANWSMVIIDGMFSKQVEFKRRKTIICWTVRIVKIKKIMHK